MAKYLDWGGVLTLWSKVKTWVAGYVKFETETGTGADAITIGSVTKVPIQSITAGTGLNTTSNDSTTDGGTIGMGSGLSRSGTMYLTKSGVTSGNYGPSDNDSLTSFRVPYLTVDKYGRVTAASNKTVTFPTDTKVNVTKGETTKAYLLGVSTTPTATAQALETISDTEVYLDTTAGKLTATNFGGKINDINILPATNGFTIAGGTTSKTLTVNNTYTLGAACAKSVDTSIGSSSSSNLPTTDAVKTYVTSLMSDVLGALIYKGTITSESTLLDIALSKGWYYIVNMPNAQTTSINIGGIECESGDMIIVNTAGTYTTSSDLGAAIDVILSNIAIITDAEINSLS